MYATYAFILGRQQDLSLWELISFFQNNDISFDIVSLYEEVVVIEMQEFDEIFVMNQLGGTIKIVKGEFVLKIREKDIIALFDSSLSKIVFGVSQYGTKKYSMLGKEIKKIMKKKGNSCKYIQAKESSLSSAQVNNYALMKKGADIVIVAIQGKWFLGKTVAVTSLKAFQKRDIEKPKRSMEVGMMPPKLARMMINIAQIKKGDSILDPFCGMGTILLEAMSMGYKHILGSDISKQQIESTYKNVEWAKKKYPSEVKLMVSDVKKLQGELTDIDAIVTEPYLGKILTGKESSEQMNKYIQELSVLYKESFISLEKVMSKWGRVVIIIPSFRIQKKNYHIDIDQMIKATSFKQVRPPKEVKKTSYSRENQYIVRNIVILEK